MGRLMEQSVLARRAADVTNVHQRVQLCMVSDLTNRAALSEGHLKVWRNNERLLVDTMLHYVILMYYGMP